MRVDPESHPLPLTVTEVPGVTEVGDRVKVGFADVTVTATALVKDVPLSSEAAM